MNPIAKIRELDERVRKLEQQLAAQSVEQPKSKTTRTRVTKRLPSLDDEAKAIVVLAWEGLMEQRGCEPYGDNHRDGQNVTRKEWLEAIVALDTDNIVPDLISHIDTLRAVLAERMGLKVVWGEPLKRMDSRRKATNGELFGEAHG